MNKNNVKELLTKNEFKNGLIEDRYSKSIRGVTIVINLYDEYLTVFAKFGNGVIFNGDEIFYFSRNFVDDLNDSIIGFVIEVIRRRLRPIRE